MTPGEIVLAAFFAGAGYATATAVLASIALRLRMRTVNRHNERLFEQANAFHAEHHDTSVADDPALSFPVQEKGPYL